MSCRMWLVQGVNVVFEMFGLLPSSNIILTRSNRWHDLMALIIISRSTCLSWYVVFEDATQIRIYFMVIGQITWILKLSDLQVILVVFVQLF